MRRAPTYLWIGGAAPRAISAVAGSSAEEATRSRSSNVNISVSQTLTARRQAARAFDMEGEIPIAELKPRFAAARPSCNTPATAFGDSPNARKCYLCARNEVSPMCPKAHGRSHPSR
jgi:hypothetical protein